MLLWEDEDSMTFLLHIKEDLASRNFYNELFGEKKNLADDVAE